MLGGTGIVLDEGADGSKVYRGIVRWNHAVGMQYVQAATASRGPMSVAAWEVRTRAVIVVVGTRVRIEITVSVRIVDELNPGERHSNRHPTCRPRARLRAPRPPPPRQDYWVSLHEACITDEYDGFDRLADVHVGVELNLPSNAEDGTVGNASAAGGVDADDGDQLEELAPTIQLVAAAGVPYRFYGPTTRPFLYIYGPNGQGVQLIGDCSNTTWCPSKNEPYDFCNDGVVGTCSTDAAAAAAPRSFADAAMTAR